MGQLKKEDINDTFPKEHLYSLKEVIEPETSWFVNISNYLATNIILKGLSY